MIPKTQPASFAVAVAFFALLGCGLDYANPALEQTLHAGTWTGDSHAFYFAKYVQIKIPPKGRP